MGLEHMLAVGCDPRNWQAHSKDFSLKLYSSIGSFTSLIFWAYSNIPFSETIPLFPFWPHEVSADEITSRSTRYRTTETIRNEEDFTIHYDNGNYKLLKTLKTRKTGGSEEFPDLCDLGRQSLWNLADYGSCQYPRSRCVEERPEHGALELKVLSKQP